MVDRVMKRAVGPLPLGIQTQNLTGNLGVSIMNRAKWIVFAVIVILPALILTAACNSTTNDTEDDRHALLLRSYEVPAEYAAEVNSVINSLLTPSGVAPIGTARIGPGGVVIVTAPASVHSGIEKMIADIGKAKPEPPPIISLTYWIVEGRPAKETAWPPQLNEIESALKAVSASEGAMSFGLHERLKIQSMSGESATLSGGIASVRQVATVREGRVLGSIEIRLDRMGLSFYTKVQIGLNKVLVLGQSGCRKSQSLSGAQEIKNEPESNVFYIVRADAESG
jgi:hypothetical protein